MRITERDTEIVRYVGRHGVVEAPQIQRKFFGTKQAAYRRLKALVGYELLTHDRVLYGRNGVYRATKAGLDFAGVELHPAGINLQHLQHSLELVNLSERMLAENPGARWITERELRSRTTRAALSEETNLIPPEPGRERMPDGLLIFEDGTKAAVELELSPKRTRRYEGYFTAYAKRRDLDEVRFYFDEQRTLERAQQIAEKYRLVGFLNFYLYTADNVSVSGQEPTEIATGEGDDA